MYEMTLLRMHEMTRLLMHGMTLLLVHEMTLLLMHEMALLLMHETTRLLMRGIYFFFVYLYLFFFCIGGCFLRSVCGADSVEPAGGNEKSACSPDRALYVMDNEGHE